MNECPANLTKQQAYLAMYAFIEAHWERMSKPEELGILLGMCSLLNDGWSADGAMISYWDDAVDKALSGKVDARLRFESGPLATKP